MSDNEDRQETSSAFGFAEAVTHLSAGGQVTRLAWWKEDKSLIVDDQTIIMQRPTLPGFSSKRTQPWVPTLADLQANDWLCAPCEKTKEPVA